jgi:thymidylate synthase
MAKVFTGDSSSQLYYDSLMTLLCEGKEVKPRGKATRELRPVVFEFTNPLNRVTFLKGRKINPYFQMAEALWILAGRSDVEWLLRYNRNMGQFSDDGVHFNAPYGERLRYWNCNDYRNFVFNPIDQLADVYRKIREDVDTRQAVAVIYNPMFDNADYKGKDTPCNAMLTFKVREGKLDLTVFNRSNDVHWGTFGANLCQFSTIQETVAAWLGLPVGTYNQITDSLHVYLDDYGAKETDKILDAYDVRSVEINNPHLGQRNIKHFTFENEPRITLGFEDFNEFLTSYFGHLDNFVNNDEYMSNPDNVDKMVHSACQAPDEYFKTTLLAMMAYRGHRLGNAGMLIECLKAMPDCQWKVSCLYFLCNSYEGTEHQGVYKSLFEHYPEEVRDYIKGV